ncbi:LNS2 protein, partial [Cooperia oncophora]
QGTSWCSCNIYLYKWYERIVISDIDGTITKSDVLGHVIPAIGGTWAHAGVAELYTRIKNNGYKMVYLSSRAIGQSHTTKQYLKSIAQDSKQLPDGPVLLSPTSVLIAFRREVIERRPEEFKIAALTD